MVTHTEPDDLRMRLSPALWAIREAREAARRPAPAAARTAQTMPARKPGRRPASRSWTSWPSWACLLEAGLLTREEFDRLKGGLLEGP